MDSHGIFVSFPSKTVELPGIGCNPLRPTCHVIPETHRRRARCCQYLDLATNNAAACFFLLGQTSGNRRTPMGFWCSWFWESKKKPLNECPKPSRFTRSWEVIHCYHHSPGWSSPAGPGMIPIIEFHLDHWNNQVFGWSEILWIRNIVDGCEFLRHQKFETL